MPQAYYVEHTSTWSKMKSLKSRPSFMGTLQVQVHLRPSLEEEPFELDSPNPEPQCFDTTFLERKLGAFGILELLCKASGLNGFRFG